MAGEGPSTSDASFKGEALTLRQRGEFRGFGAVEGDDRVGDQRVFRALYLDGRSAEKC